jgi:hypothetical protein
MPMTTLEAVLYGAALSLPGVLAGVLLRTFGRQVRYNPHVGYLTAFRPERIRDAARLARWVGGNLIGLGTFTMGMAPAASIGMMVVERLWAEQVVGLVGGTVYTVWLAVLLLGAARCYTWGRPPRRGAGGGSN